MPPKPSRKSSARRFFPAIKSSESSKSAAKVQTRKPSGPISLPPISEKSSRCVSRSENCCNTPHANKSRKRTIFVNHQSVVHISFIILSPQREKEGRKCVDTAKPSCYFSTAKKFAPSSPTEAPHTGTMAFVAKKIFLTKGVGKHRERLSSFELALRNAGIAACNIVRVSSIFPPNCKLISRSEGLKYIKPGPGRVHGNQREFHQGGPSPDRRQHRPCASRRQIDVRLSFRASFFR